MLKLNCLELDFNVWTEVFYKIQFMVDVKTKKFCWRSQQQGKTPQTRLLLFYDKNVQIWVARIIHIHIL